jgi:hypothetical protein
VWYKFDNCNNLDVKPDRLFLWLDDNFPALQRIFGQSSKS